MKKYILLALISLVTLMAGATVNTSLFYFSSDFSDATDENPLCGWSCFGSGKETADVNLGTYDTPLRDFFPAGSNAYVLLDFKGFGTLPVSNSSFTDGGAADEWLVSPEIDLTNAPSNVMLDFDVVGYGSSNECKYEVYVSTTGNKREDFSEKAVYSGRLKNSTREIVSATIHKALKDVGGKKIWLAFVNKSTDAQLMGFTSISLSEYDIDLVNKTPSFTTDEGDYEVSMTVSLMTPVNCAGFVALLEGEHGMKQEYVSEKQLGSRYNTYSFKFADPISVNGGETFDYTITLTPNYEGATPTVMQCTLTCSEGYPAVCVMEEGTGSWCGYCVRGSAALKYYAEKYGDRFIGIAVHDGDPMSVYDYISSWKEQSGINSFPSAWINRSVASDPAMGYSLVEKEMEKRVGQKVTVDEVAFDPETKNCTVKYSPEFCLDIANADVTAVAVVTEDGCSGEGSGWMQNNNYSGKTESEWLNEGMPGDMWPYVAPFAESGSRIPSSKIPFDHVAMGIFNNYYGDNTVLSSTWEGGVAQQYTMTFDFPMQKEANECGVTNWQNTSVIVILLDRTTGAVLGADKVEAKEYKTKGSGIIDRMASDIKISRVDGGIEIKGASGSKADIFAMNGILIHSSILTSDTQFVPLDATKGIVTVRVTDGAASLIRKVAL